MPDPYLPNPYLSGGPVHGPQPGAHSLNDTIDVPSGQWVYVHSSYCRAFRYNHATHGIDIEFNDGQVARYYDQPWSVYEGLVNAPSKGIYCWAHLRPSTNWTYI